MGRTPVCPATHLGKSSLELLDDEPKSRHVILPDLQRRIFIDALSALRWTDQTVSYRYWHLSQLRSKRNHLLCDPRIFNRRNRWLSSKRLGSLVGRACARGTHGCSLCNCENSRSQQNLHSSLTLESASGTHAALSRFQKPILPVACCRSQSA